MHLERKILVKIYLGVICAHMVDSRRSGHIYIHSRTSIIRTPVCHFNVKSVQISEYVQISELSDKIHYLAS